MNAEYTGKKIAELRKGKALTQRELANKLHVTDKAISKWERGINFPDLGLMEDLAAALDSTPSILLGLEEATEEEIVTSFTEISSQQAEEMMKDIQEIGWVNLFAGLVLAFFLWGKNPWYVGACIGAIVYVAIYTLTKYKAIKKFELVDIVLVEGMVFDGFIFLMIQLVTGHNPHAAVSAVMLSIAVVCVQVLFYRIMKPQWMKLLPVVLLLCWLCWGVLLEIAEPVWANDNVWNLIVYSILPAMICLISWIVCRRMDAKRESVVSSIKLFAILFSVMLVLMGMFGQDVLAKTYVQVFHKQLENYAEEVLDKTEDEILNSRYLFWETACYASDEMIEFKVGGAGLVFNSTYWGFYYSADNTHKVFQGADIPLNINGDLADWYGEGDNWGKSIRLLDKWFWYEASF